MGVDDELARAVELHQAGDILAAGTIYREILAKDPDHVDALNLLGVVMHATGDLELAVELISRATELAPDYGPALINLGNALQAAGQPDDAVKKFERALELDPSAGIAASNLASALNDLALHEEARRAGERAVQLIAELPDAHVNLGNALLGLGRSEAAQEKYTAALERDPHHPSAWFNLGNAHADAGNFSAAVPPYEKAVQFDPGNGDAHYNLANAYQQLDAYADAIESFERALAIKPEHIDAKCNLAGAWQSLGQPDRAIDILRGAIEQEMLRGDHESVDLHWNLSLALLQNGNMRDGWREFEWRWRTPTFAAFRREFSEPLWDGGDIAEKSIFVHAEQGFGDALQFVRYVPLLAAKGARVTLECRPELQSLFEKVEGVSTCLPLGADVGGFDVHAPLMSLPYLFGTSETAVPADVPYLTPPSGLALDPQLTRASDVKVGIVWSGSPTRPDNHKRSCPLSAWAPIFDVPGVTFFSLQVGHGHDQLTGTEKASEVIDLGRGFGDFADTAAAVANLDMVISVDTSVLHLAGALGVTAFALLSQPTGFLWMDDRADSPWYPSLRLFRQTTPGNWSVPVNACAAALHELVKKRLP